MSTPNRTIANLSQFEKRMLLAESLRRQAAGHLSTFPVSYGQKALLYLHQLSPHSPAYNSVFVINSRSEFDTDVLRGALQMIVDRHAVLRTTYKLLDGDFVQQVHGSMEADFEAVDASRWTAEQLQQRIQQDAARPYDLEHDPVLRLRVYSRQSDDHVLMLGAHHIAFDYWSYDVFARELAICYGAIRDRVPVQLPALSCQYTDYVLRQQKVLSGERGEQLLRYWRAELSGDLPCMNLPTDRPRRIPQTFDGAAVEFVLEAEVVKQLRKLAAEQKTTLYVVLLAAFQSLLHRYTEQEDLIVGCPLAGRDFVDCEHLIGYFANVLPMRANLFGNPEFTTFLAQVHETVLSALEHQEYPFSLLVEKLGVQRDPGRSPLVDVGFSWARPHYKTLDANASGAARELSLELKAAHQLGAPYDLTLQLLQTADSISGIFLYNTELFDRETVVALTGHFRSVIQDILSQPRQRVLSLSLMSDAERRHVTIECNQTSTPYPRDACIQELFEEQASKAPDAVAVKCGGDALTYGELNSRANQLAHYLRRRGIGPSALVAMCLERSTEMIVAMLAILKAGAAYVPLDPDYPSERVQLMVADTKAALLVTRQNLLQRIIDEHVTPVCLDSDRNAIAAESTANVAAKTTRDDLAYVMYTSGSTGRPKGVCVPHRGVVRLVKGSTYASFSSAEIFLHAAPASFDAATFEIWGALLNGASVVVVPKELVLSASQFASTLRRERITTVWLTAALFNQLTRQDSTMFSGLKQLLIGGEKLDAQHVRRVLRDGAPQQLINGYGPTESTTFATCFRIDKVENGDTNIPIGYPISNTTVYVLDRAMAPVPVGVPGELYIGGDGVARGYLNQPKLTAERFIPDPFSADPQARLYRTGDLVRRRRDGAIEFLGRMDNQLKIRGFRIEPGEIEAVLATHPEVATSAVVAIEDNRGDKRLVAYVVPRDQSWRETSQLRRFLKERLPDYMVPSGFMLLHELPLSPSGKIERRQLPAFHDQLSTCMDSFTPPESGLEESIAEIWQQALGITKIGRYDNFFDLGGHSLLLAQIHAELEAVVKRAVPIVDIFRFPTVSALAKYLAEGKPKQPSFMAVQERVRQQKLARVKHSQRPGEMTR